MDLTYAAVSLAVDLAFLSRVRLQEVAPVLGSPAYLVEDAPTMDARQGPGRLLSDRCRNSVALVRQPRPQRRRNLSDCGCSCALRDARREERHG